MVLLGKNGLNRLALAALSPLVPTGQKENGGLLTSDNSRLDRLEGIELSGSGSTGTHVDYVNAGQCPLVLADAVPFGV